MRFQCPICFYDALPYPPADYHICLCCGTEFGNDDAEFSHEQLREMWVASGAPWFFREPPKEWSPWAQLLRAGVLATIPASETQAIVDAAFSAIQSDLDYQQQELLTVEEFSRTDWEALEIGERELTGA